MTKKEILEKLAELIEREGCYSDVMTVVNLAWLKYKGKVDEQLSAIHLIAEKVIDKKTAKEMLKNEHTTGYLNLSLFPNFRETILKIANKK
jgi:hypothetical protein